MDFYFHSEVYEMASVMASGLPEAVIMGERSVIMLLSEERDDRDCLIRRLSLYTEKMVNIMLLANYNVDFFF